VARSKGRNGNRANITGRSESTDRFARLPHSILKSEAYRSLDTVARCLLTELVMIETGRNNGSLWLSIKDATDRIGLSDARPAMRAFEDLQDRGFVKMTKEAHFAIKAAETSRARCWRLTWLPYANKGPTNEWETYSAPAKTKARKLADKGLHAMARFRKALASHQMPVVNFTAMVPEAAKNTPKAIGNSTTACQP